MAERDVGVELFNEAELRAVQGDSVVAARLAARARHILSSIDDWDGACAASSLEAHILMDMGDLSGAEIALEWTLQESKSRRLLSRHLAALGDQGALREMTGDLQGALEVHQHVLEAQRQIDNPSGIAIAAGNVGRLLSRLLQNDEAAALLEESLRLFREQEDESGEINALICIGDHERGQGKLEEAEVAFGEAIERSNQEDYVALCSVALLNYGHIQRDTGQVELALDSFVESARLAGEVGDQRGKARALLAQAMVQADSDSPEDSLDAFSEAEQAFLLIEQPLGAVAASVNRCAVLCRVGRLVEGREGLHRARLSLEEAGDQRGALEVGLAEAEVEVALGEIVDANSLLDSLDVGPAGGRLVLRKALISARLHLRSGALTEASTLLDALSASSMAERFARDLLLAEIAILRGYPEAGAMVALLIQLISPDDHPREFAAALGLRAQHELWRGSLERAEESYREAIAAWEALGERLAVLQSRVGLSRARFLGTAPPKVEELRRDAEELRGLEVLEMAASARTLAEIVVSREELERSEAPSGGDDRAVVESRVGDWAQSIGAMVSVGNWLGAVIELFMVQALLGSEEIPDELASLLVSSELRPPHWPSLR